jgi:hypothetical protein
MEVRYQKGREQALRIDTNGALVRGLYVEPRGVAHIRVGWKRSLEVLRTDGCGNSHPLAQSVPLDDCLLTGSPRSAAL